MINQFITIFILTFIVTRVFTHLLHNKEDIKKSKTLTQKLRDCTNFEIHHIHLGFIGLILSFFIYFIFGPSLSFVVLVAINLSLICDQIIPLIFKQICYFSKIGICLAIILHLVVILMVIYLIY